MIYKRAEGASLEIRASRHVLLLQLASASKKAPVSSGTELTQHAATSLAHNNRHSAGPGDHHPALAAARTRRAAPPAPVLARPAAADAGSAGVKDAAPAATLELVCAGSGDRGRSLYCQAGGEARCGADATVPLHLRAWERDDGRLTIDGGDGERKRLAVRDDGRVVCVDSGEDRWKFLRRRHRAGLVHETQGGCEFSAT